jgi:thiol peroxidase
MASITLKGQKIMTVGNLPAVGSTLPYFRLTKADLSDTGPEDFSGKRLILNIFPSIDTSVCATSVRTFNKDAASLPDTAVLCISMDLPFAHSRFCGAEGLKDVITLSAFRSQNFGKDFGVTITDGALTGLFSRAIIVVNEQRKIIYTEQVPEIAQEPDYAAARKALQ